MAAKSSNCWDTDNENDLVETIFNGVGVLAYKGSNRSLYSLLEESADKLPQKTALVFRDQKLTYSELKARVQILAANLQNKYQVNPGERIAILMSNSLEFVISLFAASYLGAIVCVLNARLGPREITYMLQDSGSRIIILENFWYGRLKEYLPDTAVEIVITVCNAQESFSDGKVVNYFTLLERQFPKAESFEVHPESPAILLYTSGTTGQPKGVIITHFNLVNSVYSYAKLLNLSGEDKTVIAVPLFYVTGLLAQMLLFIYLGGAIYIMEEFHGRDLLQIIAAEKISFFHATAATYNIMIRAKDRDNLDMRSLKKVLCGGAPVSHSTIETLTEWMPWLDFRTVYGLTETSSPATLYPHRRIFEKQGSAGIPIPVVKLKIVDDQGKELPSGKIGEIVIKGAVVVPGYWNKPAETQRAIKNGWLATGDLGMVDRDGFVYILDRKKDMVIRGGENIYSSEVENALLEHPAIAEAAVIGVPDAVMGEELKACVVLKPDTSLTEDEIKYWVGKWLAKFKVPRYVGFYDSLPRNANGKVLKVSLKKEA